MGGLSNNQGRFLLLKVAVGTRTISFSHPVLAPGTTEIEVEVVAGEYTNTGEVTLGGVATLGG